MSRLSGKPKVSVIIPVYNSPDYVGQAVESVLSQTYRDCEIIVVDDGSTDNTRTALEPYLDHIQYVYQDNQGSAAARNRGIRQAKGELIAFLDADDFFILPEKWQHK
jgi:glycosyltransferase involved in cell wall biosynthesis